MLNSGMFSSKTDDWATPINFFNDCNDIYKFTLDVCASAENAKCDKYFTIAENGLAQSWQNNICWMNPPYGRDIGLWCKKALFEADEKTVIVGLLPSRTDTAWFHNYVYCHAKLHFLKGRLKFGDSKNSAPFGSVLAVWGGKSQ